MTVDDYIDAARARSGLPSDRQLGVHLGLSSGALNQWRTRRAWPSDDHMIRLAELAGLDPLAALIDLNRWRTTAVQSTRAAQLYEALSERLKAGVAVLFFVLFGVLPTVEQIAHRQSSNLADLYIMRINRLRRRLGFQPLTSHS